MDLYFSPFACSFAGRIVVQEAGLESLVTMLQVDLKTKRIEGGADFRTISPLGQVPSLRTSEGHILTENAAILLYLADQAPEAGLAPTDGYARYDLIRWLSFIGSELHMRVFKALVSTQPNQGAQEAARQSTPARL